MHCPTLKELPDPANHKSGWPWTEESKPLPEKMPDGKPWPKVSIVTPSLNQGKFIEETIRSVLLQGYPNLEYIIIDGGSTDDSVEIIRKYSAWLGYWISEPDSGQSHAINKGWKRASGEILAYLNSDDIYLPGSVITAEKLLAEHPDVSMIYGGCNYIDEQNRITGAFYGEEFDIKQMFFNYIVPQPAVFFKKIVLDKVGYLDESLHYVMDRDLWIRIGLELKVKYFPVMFTNMRRHPSAKSTAQIDEFLPERLRVFNKVFERSDIPKELKNLRRKAFSHNYILVARDCYEAEKVKQARSYLVSSILEYPPVLFRGYVVKTLAKCLIGERLNLFCRKVKKWILSINNTSQIKAGNSSEK